MSSLIISTKDFASKDVLKKLAQDLIRRLPLNDAVLANLSMLHPQSGRKKTAASVVALGRRFPNIVPIDELDNLRQEWQAYQTADLVALSAKNDED